MTEVVLSTLGEPDLGLLVGTYFGYWVVGMAMLAIGMVASFLTGNDVCNRSGRALLSLRNDAVHT